MVVTAIEEYTKGKFKIYLDEEFAFVLYKGELRRFKMEIETELSETVYEEIMNEVILKRAKKRTLYLLKDMDRTEHQIRTKLKEGCYPDSIIDKAIDYAKSYRYIDDANYVRQYMEYRSSSKSRLAVISDLKSKGVSRELIEQINDESKIDDSKTIMKLIRKKRFNPQEADKQQRQKIYMYLCRKGFRYEDIDTAMEQLKNNYED